jgi:hypothetical protein
MYLKELIMTSSAPIVTRQSLRILVASDDRAFVTRVVGRALVAIFQRQTADEKSSNSTRLNNTVGFSGADARTGTLSAKFFIKNGTLQDWALDRWLKVGDTGYPRICKYARQLNEIAEAKRDGRAAPRPVLQQQLWTHGAVRAHMINAMQNEG